LLSLYGCESSEVKEKSVRALSEKRQDCGSASQATFIVAQALSARVLLLVSVRLAKQKSAGCFRVGRSSSDTSQINLLVSSSSPIDSEDQFV
jgi:hypothetical protein